LSGVCGVSFYIKSTNNGKSWSKPIALSSNNYYASSANVFVDKNNIHIVWKQRDSSYPYTNSGIYYRRSSDGGVSWQNISKIAGYYVSDVYLENPAIAAYDNTIHVVWQDLGGAYGSYERKLLYIRSVNNGKSWTKPVLVKSNPSSSTSFNPDFAVNNSTVHLVWDEPGYGNYRIVYKRSINGGKTWTKNKSIYSSEKEIGFCSIALDVNTIHLVWFDRKYWWYEFEIYYLKSDDNGTTWNSKANISSTPSYDSKCPAVCAYKGKVHVVWQEEFTDWNYGYEIYYANNDDSAGIIR